MVYYPRFNAPSTSDLRWIQVNSGGYNQCIYGSDGAPSVLPNCTGYVHGRWMELAGVTTDNLGLSFLNARSYWTDSSSSLIRSQTPALGACMCWDQNNDAGHVAIVEEIASDGSWVKTSESDWGLNYFVSHTRYRDNGWKWWSGSTLIWQGFLIHPGISPDPPGPGPDPPGPAPHDPRILLYYAHILNNKKILLKNFKIGGK